MASQMRLDDLILRHRAGEPVETELYQLGRALSISVIVRRGWWITGGTMDDAIQEGLIAFWYAVEHWNPARGRFTPFAAECIRCALVTAQTKANRLKHQPLNSALSLDKPIKANRGRSRLVYLGDAIPDPGADPLDYLLDQEDRQETAWLLAGLLQGLSDLEREALLRTTFGQTYAEAAQALGTNTKAIDNALQRAKEKLRRRREALSA